MYNFNEIEKKWQKYCEDNDTFKVENVGNDKVKTGMKKSNPVIKKCSRSSNLRFDRYPIFRLLRKNNAGKFDKIKITYCYL